MKKFTRKYYNKKLVALGMSIFMGIGLTSTGFAAWVMSKDANETPEGNVNVAIITDASAKIMLSDPAAYDENNKIWTINDDFSFDAKETDVDGRIRFGGEGTGEDLTITITGYLSGNEGVAYDLTAQLDLPDGIEAALDQGYIAWDPEVITEEVDYRSVTPVNMDDQGRFTITIAFVWGSKFGGMNPCEYYDTHETGKDVPDEDMNEELAAFHSVISTGLDAKTSEDTTVKYSGKFKLTLSATPSAVVSE